MKRYILSFGLLAALALPATASAQQATTTAAAPSCQFILGFKTLHDMSAGNIGDCVDNQAFAGNGDATQHTTKGLMVWRKSDNWTAFTNGYMTWINGPDGLVSRLNTARFPWEHDTTPTSPAPSSSPAASAAASASASPGAGLPPLPEATGQGSTDQPISDLYSITPTLPLKLGPFTNTFTKVTGNCTGTPEAIVCDGSDGSRSEQVKYPDGSLTIDGSGPNGRWHLKNDPSGTVVELTVNGQTLL